MYNAELKERFLVETTNTEAARAARRKTFNLFQKIETEEGKDVCTMSAEKIQAVLNNATTGTRARSSENDIVTIRSYIKWCASKNVEGVCLDGLNITSPAVEQMRTRTVKSPLHLKKFLEDVFIEEDGTTFDPIKCFFWMAYGGCREEDVMYLTSNDIDFERRIIKTRTWQGILYKEGIDTVRQCVEAKSFLYINSMYINKGWIVRERVPGNCIFRGVRGASEPDLSVFRSNISRKIKAAIAEGKTDLNLSYYRVWLSGAFYRLRELEIAGYLTDKNFEGLANMFLRIKAQGEYHDRHLNYKEDDPSITVQDRNTFLRRVNDYKKDYENWKLTII